MNKDTFNKPFDQAGIFFSGACAAHCLLVPLLFMIAPSTALILQNEWIHLLLLVILAPLAFVAFIKGKGTHNNKSPMALGLLGMMCLLLALLSEEYGIPYLESSLTLTGSITLILAHGINLKLLKNRSAPSTEL